MNYRNYDSGTYESRIMKEIMMIISVVIIGICIMIYYINNNFDHGENVDSDADTANTSTGISTVAENSEQVNSVENRSLSIENIEQSVVSVDPLTNNATSGVPAEIVCYSGNVGYEGQEDWYSFIAPYEGRYRVDMTGIQNGTAVRLYLYDELGDVIASDTYCENEEGFTAKAIEAGKTYTIKVRQEEGYTSYSLSIGMQKAPVDLTGYTEIVDSVEFIDQRNVYYFVAPVTGRYRFDMSEIYSGTDVGLYIFDSLGDTMTSDTYCTNGEGITASDLQAGVMYEIQVRQDDGFSGYKLNIGYQKKAVDISDYTVVNDSVEYTDQRNGYTYTARSSNDVTITISGIKSGVSVEVYVFDDLGYTVVSDTYFTNDESITIKNCTVGENYEIQIRQDDGMSDYTLEIG